LLLSTHLPLFIYGCYFFLTYSYCYLLMLPVLSCLQLPTVYLLYNSAIHPP